VCQSSANRERLLAFVTTEGFTTGTLSYFSIFKVTDPSNILYEVGWSTYGGNHSPYYLGAAHGLDIYEASDNKLYCIIASEDSRAVTMFDVDDPTSASHKTYFQDWTDLTGARDVSVIDIGGTKIAAVAVRGKHRLVLFDVDNATFTEKGDISGFGSPNYLGYATSVECIVIDGTEYAILTAEYDDALTIFDISDYDNIIHVGVISGAGSPNYLDHARDVKLKQIGSNFYAFVCSINDSSFTIIDITTPSSPTLVKTFVGSGAPYYLDAPRRVAVITIQGKEYATVACHDTDNVSAFDVTTPASASFVGRIYGAGSPNYLNNVKGCDLVKIGGTPYLFTVAGEPDLGGGPPDDDALSSFEISIGFDGSSNTTTAVTADLTGTFLLAGTAATQTSVTAYLTIPADMAAFMAEVRKPHWLPVRRAYMLDSGDGEHEITNWVSNFDRILWQVEQALHPNVFTANNCQISLKNEDARFDIDNASNFFVGTLGRSQDGYKVPVVIKCGYRTSEGDEKEILVTVFYGVLVDIDTTLKDDVATIDLQCVSRKLRDAKIEDFGEQWTNERLYGGDTFCYTSAPIPAAWDGTQEPNIPVKNTRSGDPTGNYPGAFPPFGFVELDDEIIYYSYYENSTLKGCMRGRFGTTPAAHDNETEVALTLMDGSATDGRYFQFMAYPLSEGSVENATSSDGQIDIVEEGTLLGVPNVDKKTTGFIDYDAGVLELLAAPTDLTTLTSTYKSCFRTITYYSLAKRLLEAEGFATTLVEEAVLADYLGRTIPINIGKVTSAYQGGSLTMIPGMKAYALAVDSSGNIYIGVGKYLIKWDGEKYDLLANLGPDNFIYKLGLDASGNVYGISGKTDSGTYRSIFKFDGEAISFLLTGDVTGGADYRNYGDETDQEGGQWPNFTVDDTNSVVWYLFRDSGGNRGIAKIALTGGSPTKYTRSLSTNGRSDFVDTGTTIEFFYTKDVGGGGYEIRYETLTKSTGTWVDHGFIKNSVDLLIPVDCIYNSTDGKIYMNILRISVNWHCWFCSIDKDFITETDLIQHDGYGDKKYDAWHGRFCGGVIYDGHVWMIRGTGVAMDGDQDEGTGHIYKIGDNEIEDMGALSLRPVTEDTHFLRDEVSGHSAVMVYRSSDQAIFYIATDKIVRYDDKYGYSLGHYAKTFVPIVREANLNGRKVWDVLSELAKLANFELGVSKEGVVFWRERLSTTSVLASNINASVVTIPSDGTNIDDFESDGMIQIGTEVIKHTGISGNDFTGCTRGAWESTAATHSEDDRIWEIHEVLANFAPAEGANLKYAQKEPNWDDIYNYIEVPYGDRELVFDWKMNKGPWIGSSEQKYGRRTMRIDNNFLTDDDIYQAESLGFRAFDFWHHRHTLVTLETKWQPQLDLGNTLSIKQTARTIFDYSIARLRQMEMVLSDFYIKMVALVAPGRYRENVYEYEYDE